MLHVAYARNNPPYAPAACLQYYMYPDFVTFDQARQNAAAAAAGFWQRVTPYVLQEMAANRNKISEKYLQKQRDDIGSTIEVGLIGGAKFLVLINPGKQNSRMHAYLFFATASAEIDQELYESFVKGGAASSDRAHRRALRTPRARG